MERIVSKRYRTLEYLLAANVLFWLIIGVIAVIRYALLGKGMMLVALLMMSEFILYSIGFGMIRKRMAFSKLFVFGLSLGTAILSLLDEVGAIDILSFVLSMAVVVTVITLWMAEKRKESIRRSAVED